MTTRALVFTAVLVAATAATTLAQTAPAAPQPQTAPRARGAVPPSTAEPRMAIPPGEARATTPVTAPAPAERRNPFQAVNIRVDLTLTDQRGGAQAIKRTVTVMAADGYTGSIRTQSRVVGVNEGPVPLNVDASPTLLADGKIRLGINLQYDWPVPVESGAAMARGTVMSTSLHDQLMLIVESGKSLIVAQSADPVGDRQVTVEVKATILK